MIEVVIGEKSTQPTKNGKGKEYSCVRKETFTSDSGIITSLVWGFVSSEMDRALKESSRGANKDQEPTSIATVIPTQVTGKMMSSMDKDVWTIPMVIPIKEVGSMARSMAREHTFMQMVLSMWVSLKTARKRASEL